MQCDVNDSGNVRSRFEIARENNLKNLSELKLSYNTEWTFELPEAVDLDNEAAIFPHLEILELKSCRINGEFLLFLQSAKRLRILDLGNNNISGKIPTRLWGLPKLEYLDLSHNMFNGFDEIVNISAQTTMFPQLEILICDYCNIKGEFPWILEGAKRLTGLHLSHNNLSGKIPMWLWGQTNLLDLDLSNNMLHGFEEEAVNMSDSVNLNLDLRTSLVILDLSNNNIRGPIPPSFFCNMPRLQSLYLSRNSLSSTIPDCISNLTSLLYLDLSSNQLQGQVPRGLICKPYLAVLDLKGNQLTVKIAKLLHNCSGDSNFLRLLDLSNNSFTGSLPDNWLTGFDNIQSLDMSNNDLHGPIPDIVSFTKSLRVLALNDNTLTGMVPRSLSNCSQLEIINLASNELSDLFPSWLAQLDNLHVLILRSNKLYGNIMLPKYAYAFSSLQVLDISRNQFLGYLPPELFQELHFMMLKQSKQEEMITILVYVQIEVELNIKRQTRVWKLMSGLTSIDLSNNLFIGKIPEAIGALEGLYSLNLSWNNLDGPIPKSLGQLSTVESLDLSHNNLSGHIPEELMRNTFLSVLDLSYNNLQGRIPQGNQFNTFNATSFDGNPRLCGPPLAISCPSNKSGSEDSVNRVEGNAQDPNWEYLTAGIGVVVGVLTITLPLMFSERFASWYWNCVDRVAALTNLQDIL